MLRVSIIAVLKTYKVFLIKCSYVKAGVAIQTENDGSILNDQHELCSTMIEKIASKALLILLTELIS